MRHTNTFVSIYEYDVEVGQRRLLYVAKTKLLYQQAWTLACKGISAVKHADICTSYFLTCMRYPLLVRRSAHT